jgi:hypothetical protein
MTLSPRSHDRRVSTRSRSRSQALKRRPVGAAERQRLGSQRSCPYGDGPLSGSLNPSCTSHSLLSVKLIALTGLSPRPLRGCPEVHSSHTRSCQRCSDGTSSSCHSVGSGQSGAPPTMFTIGKTVVVEGTIPEGVKGKTPDSIPARRREPTMERSPTGLLQTLP